MSSSDDDLSGDEECDEGVRDFSEVTSAVQQIVLVAAVGVSLGVHVVAKQVESGWDALGLELLVCARGEVSQ